MDNVRPRLLIVDDGLLIRMSLLSMFTALHYAVRSAPDGFTALVEIRVEIPDIVISELNMPGMSGYELLSIVRSRFPSIRRIAMSRAFSGETVSPGVAAEALYPKDAHPGLLFRMVEDTIHRRRSRFRRTSSAAEFWTPACTVLGEPCGTITCPGCLRAFSESSENSAALPTVADCVYSRGWANCVLFDSPNRVAPGD
jgi:CheY-like chemotaxis protein